MNAMLKNKGLGYWLCTAASVLALVTAIVIFATQAEALPHTVTGKGTYISIVLLVGVAVQIVVTFVPLRFASILSVICFTAAFGVTANTIPNAVADYFNKVAYTGGDFGMCMLYAVATLLIALISIVACFFGQTKDGKAVI